jgi:hypothetical protein
VAFAFVSVTLAAAEQPRAVSHAITLYVCEVEPVVPCAIAATPVGVESELAAPAPGTITPSPFAKSCALPSVIVVGVESEIELPVAVAFEPDAPHAVTSQYGIGPLKELFPVQALFAVRLPPPPPVIGTPPTVSVPATDVDPLTARFPARESENADMHRPPGRAENNVVFARALRRRGCRRGHEKCGA